MGGNIIREVVGKKRLAVATGNFSKSSQFVNKVGGFFGIIGHIKRYI